MNDDSRRLAVFNITPELIVGLGVGTYRVVENALPDDVEVAGVHYDPKTATIQIVIRSKAFPVVFEGSHLTPVKPPKIKSCGAT